MRKKRTTKDLSNQKFGKLTAVEIQGQATNSLYLWLCICDCGNTLLVRSSSLISGHTQSCGCSTKIRKGIYSKVDRAYNVRFSQTRSSAKKRSLAFSLSFDDWYRIVINPCYYCDVIENPIVAINKIEYQTVSLNGLDRLNNSIGYEIGNVVPCCGICNLEKRDTPYLEFIARTIKRADKFAHMRGVV